MSWVTFETPDGRKVDAWLVTDEADTPQGTEARIGQWVTREQKQIPGEGFFVGYSTIDQPPTDWKQVSTAPAGTPANSPIELPPDPRADLWGMSNDELGQLATELGVEFDPGRHPGRPPRFSMIYQIDAKRRGAVALLEEKPPIPHIQGEAPIKPHSGPPSAVEIDPGPFEG